MKYTIKLLSDWHVGSGLSAGAESDNEVLKDENNLPYIPGKTIKGLLKGALYEMPENQASRNLIEELFGYEKKDKNEKVEKTCTGKLYFSNASLSAQEQKEIVPELADFLYRHKTQTKINENGVAKANSLRAMEICMPIELKGEIVGEMSEEEEKLMQDALKWVRHLGVNRNRGLGRCQFITDKTNSND